MMKDKDEISKIYEGILQDFFSKSEEKAYFTVAELGKELVLSQAGPDVLIDIHATALKKAIKDAEPMTISRMVVNANDLLLNGIMAYAMTYYGFLDQIAAEKRKLEAARAEASMERDKLDDIVSAIDADLLLLDRDMTILWVNRRLSERKSVDGGEVLIGKRCNKAYCNIDQVPIDCPAALALASGKPVRLEHPITHPDGDLRHYRFTCSPILGNDGAVAHVLELVQDITERNSWEETLKKKTAELKDTNRELERFNKLFVDRELRMVELMKEIRKLKGTVDNGLWTMDDGTMD